MPNPLSFIKAFDAVRKDPGAMSFRKDLKAIWRAGSRIEMRPNLERMLIDPMMGDWFLKTETTRDNKPWSHHTQGVACDGRNWFVASTPYQDARKDMIWFATTTIFR